LQNGKLSSEERPVIASATGPECPVGANKVRCVKVRRSAPRSTFLMSTTVRDGETT
jgi:ABC-type ATPase with predicted acetyltransferase domain